ncbi:hypothetical protein PU629_19305 [Pullulanibacillus sp. KACC 23026]|uniref:hypothetical protein n=1 Tax=Pullulanibacillus sp. KACC 23026 TaxID=3028315 RepID=UPI0023AF27FE|nr:hypothetical protein [Pullulanibacillus sp. KACC 23026]WEG12241.1 hypothetical protein PU629_19305 [Pullulanibacillus sp. KACC 23026]
MLPTKKQLVKHLSGKMTNQEIAKIYGVPFQKITDLIKQYNFDADKLRRTNMYTVYEHLLDGDVVYVGSGLWYRCRRSSNRRNLEHKALMEQGKLDYIFVAEYEKEEDARRHEIELIKKYKVMGLAKFNKKIG